MIAKSIPKPTQPIQIVLGARKESPTGVSSTRSNGPQAQEQQHQALSIDTSVNQDGESL